MSSFFFSFAVHMNLQVPVKQVTECSRKWYNLHNHMNYIFHLLIPHPEYFYEQLVHALIVHLKFS
jgi:hypothetical protein